MFRYRLLHLQSSFTAFLLLVTVNTAHAATYYVATCGSDAWAGVQPGCVAPLGPKRNIQTAINLATHGDTIIVLPGTYFETIDLNGKAITLTAPGGSATTIIDGNGDGPVVMCNSLEGAGTVIQGFTIRDGSSDEHGGGMFIALASPTVRECRFENNTASSWGGGLYGVQSSSLVEECEFVGNSAFVGGGAYFSLGQPTISDCTFANNSSGIWGGALLLHQSVNATVTDSFFLTNSSTVGGGLYVTSGTATISVCDFSGNEAGGTGGGMYSSSMHALDLVNCHFNSNLVAGGTATVGGGLAISGGDATLLGCSFEDNAAPDAGGLAVKWMEAMLVQQCSFEGNHATADGEGGAAHVLESAVAFHGCGFVNNNARNGAGVAAFDSNLVVISCSFASNDAANVGGGIFFSSENGLLDVLDSVFNGNTATSGGGIRFGYGVGSIYDCSFEGNVASLIGGGVTSGSATVDILDTEFIGNHSDGSGGGLTGGNLILRCTFDGNSADRGGGAASIIHFSNPLFGSCEFKYNTATEAGGAIAIATNGNVQLVNTLVHHNDAPADMGAIYEADSNGTLSIHNSLIANNNGGGIAINNPDSMSTVGNTIIWGNTNGGQFPDDLPSAVQHCCIQGGGVPGVGNISASPGFLGAIVGNYRLNNTSPCRDAGHNWLVPTDFRDADDDGDKGELFPFDFDGNPRITDNISVRAGGCMPMSAVVDIGPFESEGIDADEPRLGDIVDSATLLPPADGVVDGADLSVLIGAWGTCEGCCPADLDLNGVVDGWDLALLIGSWG